MKTQLRSFTRARVIALAALLAVVGLVWPGAQQGRAWPGGIDATFGDGGVTFLDNGIQEAPIAIAVLPDGATVTLLDLANNVGLLKLDAAGRRAAGFGNNGLVVEDRNDRPVALRVLPGGKLLVLVQWGGWTFGLRRYNVNGTLDVSFSGDGDVAGPMDVLVQTGAFAVQPDGKIVVAGVESSPDPTQTVVWRLSADGTMDPTFGVGGRAEFPRADGYVYVSAITVQANGGIVVATSNYAGGAGFTRLSTDGVIDETFGAGGTVTTTANVRDLMQMPDGSLLYSGRVGTADTSHVYRLSSAGAPSGVSADLPGDALALSRTADGRIVAAGTIEDPQGGALFAARLTPALALDSAFGGGGVVAYAINNTAGSAVTVQPSGRIVVAGHDHGGQDDFAFVMGISGGSPLGFMVDGWGGLHPLSSGRAVPATTTNGAPYWPGWDIARGVALKGDQTGGYVLDGWGGIHTFGVNGHARPARVAGGPYWPGWDIARDVAILPDETGGYVLDGWGGLHPFGLNGHAPPPHVSDGPYWAGWDIARGLALLPDGTGGYVLDGWGGIHPFAIGDWAPPDSIEGGPYWPGWDIARDVELSPFGGAYVLDGWGGVHRVAPYEGYPLPPVLTGTPYWPGWDIARSISMP